jgi:hypothetical protein
VHLTIPTANAWVPLRILTLGLGPEDPVQADVYLLTDAAPALLPAGRPGIDVERSEPASAGLLADLRADTGMGWVPDSGMWLTYLRVDTTAGRLTHDLATDSSGRGSPSRVAAGLAEERTWPGGGAGGALWPWTLIALGVVAALAGGVRLARPRR